MLHEAQRTSAPSSTSVSISTAVWIVMCNEPVTRTPLSGFDGPNFLRTETKPGISCSATEISLRPHSASVISLTWKSAELDFEGARVDILKGARARTVFKLSGFDRGLESG